MFEDIYEHHGESCSNCWWSSGRAPGGDQPFCSYNKIYQAPFMWCNRWKSRDKNKPEEYMDY